MWCYRCCYGSSGRESDALMRLRLLLLLLSFVPVAVCSGCCSGSAVGCAIDGRESQALC